MRKNLSTMRTNVRLAHVQIEIPEDMAGVASNPFRKFAFYCALMLVFLRFSMLHQAVTYLTHINLYPLYVLGIPALLGVVLTGGFARAFRQRATIYWLCFAVWLVATIPFSIWKGGSFFLVASFFRAELLMLFLIAGLTVGWKECRLMLLAIVASTFVSLGMSRLFSNVESERMSLEFGTVANANDFAAHLLLLLPFLLWVLISARSVIGRLLALAGLGYGTYLVLASGSRGALIALTVELLFFSIHGRTRHKLALWVLAPIVLIAALSFVPEKIMNRITTFTSGQQESSQEAMESAVSRERLLHDSIICTLEHPLFGVGAGQFTTYEGVRTDKRAVGVRWHNAHNSFLAAGSEGGIPALIFYLAAIGSTVLLLGEISRRTKGDDSLRPIADATLCIRLALVGFCTAIFFLNFTYSFYLPAVTGLAIALHAAAPSSAIQPGGKSQPSRKSRDTQFATTDVPV